MNKFLMEGIAEYRLQKRLEADFETDTARILELIRNEDRPSNSVLTLMLTPLIEMAWIDGRVGRAEQNAILKAAEIYGLLENDIDFLEIMDRLTTRPTSAEIEGWWDDIYTLLAFLPLSNTISASSLLLEQTRYVARLGQKRVYGLWRGYDIGDDERSKIEETEERIARLQSAVQGTALFDREFNGPGDFNDIIKLLPLIKVAWADGRITKRERRIIFDSLIDLGIEPTDENLEQLMKWLELSPDDEFITASLQKLRQEFELLDDDRRADEKYGLISKCTMVAEASGGNSASPSGGHRICAEEIAAVKHIARLLAGAVDRSRAEIDQTTFAAATAGDDSYRRN